MILEGILEGIILGPCGYQLETKLSIPDHQSMADLGRLHFNASFQFGGCFLFFSALPVVSCTPILTTTVTENSFQRSFRGLVCTDLSSQS